MSGMYSAAFMAAASIYKGVKQKSADDQSAALLNQEAGQSVAAGIQGGIQSRRKAAYVASDAQAKIAASGLTTTGTSAQATLAGIRGQGEYDALTQVYQGEDRSAELDTRAGGLRDEGNAAMFSGFTGALSSGVSFYDKYGS